MKEFTFIRRYLQLKRQEQSFHIVRNTLYKVLADNWEAATQTLVQEIDNMEGRDGVVANDGFPPGYSTKDSKVMYIGLRGLLAHCYQQDVEQVEGKTDTFREWLTEKDDDKEEGIYQGFYADDQLLCPRALTVHRLQCRGDEFNYLFETENGRNSGEYEKYLFYEQVLYKSLDFLDRGIQMRSEQDV